jgi:pimaricinolide synthase PimS1
VKKLFAELKKKVPDQPLCGIVHAAGILDFCELGEQTAERLDATFKPKCDGALHLHEHTKDMNLDLFLVFSSISALVGLSRGTSYSAANHFLDALVEWRRAQGLAATSVQWGAVAEVGMANRGETHAGGDMALKMITPKMVKAALKVLVTADLPAQVAFARADWTRFISDLGMTPSILSRFEQVSSGSNGLGDAMKGLSAAEQEEKIQQVVLKTAKATLHIDTLAADQPLMEAGMDSLTAVEFRNKLTQELPGIKLASTLMFDYPTVDAIATFALGQIAPADEGRSARRAPVATVSGGGSEELAILGMA